MYQPNIPDFIQKLLRQIEHYLREGGDVPPIESEYLELKGLAGGTSDSLKKVICGMLNKNGGYIIGGIEEDSTRAKLTLTGYNDSNEHGLVDIQIRTFRNDRKEVLDLTENISFDTVFFMDKKLCLITVKPLAEDVKYIQYKNEFFERILTKTQKINENRLKRQEEYKREIEYAKELTPVNNMTLSNLKLSKIHRFIHQLNVKQRIEADFDRLEEARPFLIRKNCLTLDGAVTTLGALLFAEFTHDYLGNRAAVDCFVRTDVSDISRAKHYAQGDILSIMEESFEFVWDYIRRGITYLRGGQETTEYPERLLREVINNALAHRDYTIDKVVSITIRPDISLEIANPGRFKEKMLIRHRAYKSAVDDDKNPPQIPIFRVLPGIPETPNPKLANILKSFQKIESQGIGMATLVDLCLKNEIDIPYYDLSNPDIIRLVLQSGVLLDKKVLFWLNSYQNYLETQLQKPLTAQHKAVLAYFYKSELENQRNRYTIQFSDSNNHTNSIKELLNAKLIFEHESSIEYSTTYLLQRDLMRENYNTEIAALLNNNLNDFSPTVKLVLNVLYRHNFYNKTALRPVDITPEIYAIQYGAIINPKQYETLGRSVRKICESLSKQDFLIKNQDRTYQFRTISTQK